MKQILTGVLLAISVITNAQDRFENVTIKTTQLTESTYMIEGAGGNIMIRVGDAEILMVDSQFAPLSDRIKDAINTISDLPISYLVNTHHHGDHTGGNANFNTDDTVVIAQENAKKRVETTNKDVAAVPEKTLDEEMTITIDTENVMLIHVHNAHTDGDTFVYLTDRNVLHMGDVYFSGKFPYIDLKSGGSIKGYIEAQKIALNMINEETIIVPGHGAVSNFEELMEYIIVLENITVKIQKLMEANVTKEDIISNESITKAADDAGYGNGFINSLKFRETVYDSLLGK